MNRGFTLLEVILVVGIMAIIATITLPSFRDRSLADMNSEVSLVSQEIQHFHELALYEHEAYIIKFVNNEIRVYTSLTLPPCYRRTLPEGFVVSSNFDKNTLTFLSNGVPSQGGTITFTKNQLKREVTVMPSTGAVRVL